MQDALATGATVFRKVKLSRGMHGAGSTCITSMVHKCKVSRFSIRLPSTPGQCMGHPYRNFLLTLLLLYTILIEVQSRRSALLTMSAWQPPKSANTQSSRGPPQPLPLSTCSAVQETKLCQVSLVRLTMAHGSACMAKHHALCGSHSPHGGIQI